MSSVKLMNANSVATGKKKKKKKGEKQAKVFFRTHNWFKGECPSLLSVLITHRWLDIKFKSEKNFSQNCLTVCMHSLLFLRPFFL